MVFDCRCSLFCGLFGLDDLSSETEKSLVKRLLIHCLLFIRPAKCELFRQKTRIFTIELNHNWYYLMVIVIFGNSLQIESVCLCPVVESQKNG